MARHTRTKGFIQEGAEEPRLPAPSEGDAWGTQFGELMRILRPRPQQFRVRYFAASAAIVREIELTAPDLAGAVKASASMPWPPGAIGLRIVDADGREAFERLNADLR